MIDDPTLDPAPKDDDDIMVCAEENVPVERASSAGTELSLVAVPIEPSCRKLMTKTDNAIRNAQSAFELHKDKRPEVAVRFQGNQVKMLELQLKILQFNAELHGKGSGVDTSKGNADNPSTVNNTQINFGDIQDEGTRQALGQLLSGQRVVDIPPRGTAGEPATGDGG